MLEEVRLHLRKDGTDEDFLLQGLIIAARQRAEGITHRALITQVIDWTMDKFPSSPFYVPCGPLQSVTAIYVFDPASSPETEVMDSSLYQVDTVSDPGRIHVYGYHRMHGHVDYLNAITVRFTAGYGGAAKVPMAIKAAMLLMIGHLFEHREEVSDFQTFAVPNAVNDLLAPYVNHVMA